MSVADSAERAMSKWLAIVSEGTSPAALQTVDAVFDTFYANAVRHLADQ
jgi:hypothetical protein